MVNTVAVSVKLSADEKRRLARIAKKTKRSAHFLMREAMTQFLQRQEAQLAFLAEAEEAWKDYKDTGLYISAEAMRKWAEEELEELPPPEKA